MSSATDRGPQKPPRRVAARHNEPDGLLLSVVRTLTTSANNDQRELEKKRLENGFKETELAVDNLVSVHKEDLTTSLQSFRKISKEVTGTRERIRNVKNNLSSCKSLLQCKRDELRKLWLESAEQRYVLQLLEKVEEVKSVPHEVNDAVNRKLYLKASESIVKALSTLNNDLSAVDGLVQFKLDLEKRKEELFNSILEELNKQLYLRPSEELLAQLRNLRGGPGVGSKIPAMDSGSRLSIPSSVKSLSGTYLKSMENEQPLLLPNGCAVEDVSESHPEASPIQFISVLIEALGLLGKLSEANDRIAHGIQRGLSKIIQHASTFIYDHFSLQHSIGDSRNLAELLAILFRQFKIVAALHSFSIDQLKRVRDSRGVRTGGHAQSYSTNKQSGGVTSTELVANGGGSHEMHVYTNSTVWNQIQAALQHLLNEYLDIKNAGVTETPTLEAPRNLSSYFAKKRPPKPKRPIYFRFDWTKHSMNLASYAKEKGITHTPTLNSPVSGEGGGFVGGSGVGESGSTYVCPPSQANIVVAFKPLMKFVTEIESRLGGGGEECLLRDFVKDYVRDSFMPYTAQKIDSRLDSIVSGSDAWTTLITADELKLVEGSNPAVPLLSSAVRMKELCVHVQSLMTSVPLFAEELAEFWLQALQAYHASARGQYDRMTKSILRQEASGQEIEWRKISSAWAVDEDISRLLKSLPNWLILMESTRPNAWTPGTPFSPASAMVHSQSFVREGSMAEIRERNMRESEILIGNLGTQKKIEDWEIISEINQLKFLANMHESIEFFCSTTRQLLSALGPTVLAKLKTARVSGRADHQQTNGLAGGPDATDSSSDGGGQLMHVIHRGGESGGAKVPTVADEFEAHMIALEDMSSTCLLMLHLEVRVHCFYYLLPIARQATHLLGSNQSQEVDPMVLNLNRNMVRLDDALRSNLQTKKVRYVFEGLGHLVSAIFINSSHHILKINDNGKKRMGRNIFAIQQCLSNITGTRELDLDSARRYFDLLYRTPDEILNLIVEEGPEFSELEYNYLLALSVRSHPGLSMEPGALEQRISRLREIMMERKKQVVNGK